MLKRARDILFTNLKNIPGWRTARKIVIIECDDWGGIRMPSAKVRQELLDAGLSISDNRFDHSDTLANEEDLNSLFGVLESVKDRNGHPAVMTPVTVVGNPDFARIKASGYTDYYVEPFTETLRRYYPQQDVFRLWKEGMDKGIFVPELHGRDHVSVQFWLQLLQKGHRDLLTAFEHDYIFLELPSVPEPARGFRAEYYFTEEGQKPFLIDAIHESVHLFEKIFSYRPAVFVPGNGFFHPDLDKVVSSTGLRYLNENYISPYPAGGEALKYRRYVPGQKGPDGLIYYTRNCAFEPTAPGYKGVDATLKQVAAAFRWGKPANISTHRVNFTGAIHPENRAKGLEELKSLLQAIVKEWPAVEFLSSASAFNDLTGKTKV